LAEQYDEDDIVTDNAAVLVDIPDRKMSLDGVMYRDIVILKLGSRQSLR